MANYYDTRIECLTNSELLKFIDPKKIIKSTCSKFDFSISDELIFESRNCTMHEDILLLSNKFPREIFLVRYCDSPEYDQTKESILDGELNCDILENHYDECVASSVTIHAEFENYKLSVDKTRNSELVLHGYHRNSKAEDWKEILIESKKEEYGEFPF